jgi:peptidoglycan/LPS O-acetylase OafA/YrhL
MLLFGKHVVQADHRLSEIDGLRAFATLSVMLAHAHFDLDQFFSKDTYDLFFGYVTFGNGVYGVDVFFAISGFLITSIIIDNRTSGNFLAWFYLRRILRIIPLAMFGIALAFALAKIFGERATAPQALLYVLNLGNYQSLIATIDPDFAGVKLGHYWSLAVEEQFYLVWPLLLLTLVTMRSMIALSLAAIAVSLAVRAALSIWWPDLQVLHFGYYLTIARMDGLGIGALMAILLRAMPMQQARLVGKTLVIAALAYAAIDFVARGPATSTVVAIAVLTSGLIATGLIDRLRGLPDSRYQLCFVTGFCLLDPGAAGLPLPHFFASAMTAGLLVLIAADGGANVSRLLGNPIAVYLGRISYGIYVYHSILFAFTPELLSVAGIDPRENPMAIVLGRMVLALGVAAVSWHWFEQPLLRLKDKYPLRKPKRIKAWPVAILSAWAGALLLAPILGLLPFIRPTPTTAHGGTPLPVWAVSDSGHYAVNAPATMYAPANLFDGDQRTCWHSPPQDGKTMHSIRVQWPAPVDASTISFPPGPVVVMRPNNVTLVGTRSDGHAYFCSRINGILFRSRGAIFETGCTDPISSSAIVFDDTRARYVLQCEINIFGSSQVAGTGE